MSSINEIIVETTRLLAVGQLEADREQERLVSSYCQNPASRRTSGNQGVICQEPPTADYHYRSLSFPVSRSAFLLLFSE